MTGVDAVQPVVVKLGGSILDTSDDVELAVERVASMDVPRVVVVSALNGVTDWLIDRLDAVKNGESAVEQAINELRHRHVVGAPEAVTSSVTEAIAPPIDQLERLLYGVAYTGELTPRVREHILSYGERLAARIIAAGLAGRGIDAIALDADELGVVTDGTFGRATADIGATRTAVRGDLEGWLDDGTIPVVTGFFGRDPAGDVTTFGRGGSDYSGAIIARSIDAARYEVWKDVSGFLTAEPDRISQARPIRSMSYDEAAELAYLGVEVLHPRTLEPLRKPEIPVVVSHVDTDDPAGTRIGPAVDTPRQLRAIGAREGFGIVRMHGSAMAHEPGVGQRVFAELSDHGITVVNMAASQATFALLIDAAAAPLASDLLESATIPAVESVSHTTGHALVCIVGQGIGLREGVAGQVFSVVGDAGVNIDMISVGSSDVAMSFVVDEADLHTALAALHEALLEGGGTTTHAASSASLGP